MMTCSEKEAKESWHEAQEQYPNGLRSHGCKPFDVVVVDKKEKSTSGMMAAGGGMVKDFVTLFSTARKAFPGIRCGQGSATEGLDFTAMETQDWTWEKADLIMICSWHSALQ